jgi:hypothetical protein
MEVGLTFRVTVEWKDPRLQFSNILNAPFEQEEIQQVLGISFTYQILPINLFLFRRNQKSDLAPSGFSYS